MDVVLPDGCNKCYWKKRPLQEGAAKCRCGNPKPITTYNKDIGHWVCSSFRENGHSSPQVYSFRERFLTATVE